MNRRKLLSLSGALAAGNAAFELDLHERSRPRRAAISSSRPTASPSLLAQLVSPPARRSRLKDTASWRPCSREATANESSPGDSVESRTVVPLLTAE